MSTDGHELILSLVRQLVGTTCEMVTNPHGSILSIDFGPMSLPAEALPMERPHGWRHLTVLSPWRIDDADHVLVDWNVDGGANGRIAPLVQVLLGQTVESAHTAPPGWDLSLKWSNGLELRVFGDCDDYRDKAWMILGTDGVQASAKPVVRSLYD